MQPYAASTIISLIRHNLQLVHYPLVYKKIIRFYNLIYILNLKANYLN